MSTQKAHWSWESYDQKSYAFSFEKYQTRNIRFRPASLPHPSHTCSSWFLGYLNSTCLEGMLAPSKQKVPGMNKVGLWGVQLFLSLHALVGSLAQLSSPGGRLAWWSWMTFEGTGLGRASSSVLWRISCWHTQMPEGDLTLKLHALIYSFTQLKLKFGIMKSC